MSKETLNQKDRLVEIIALLIFGGAMIGVFFKILFF